MGEEDDNDPPRSIASLRSRFENLAAANGPTVISGQQKPLASRANGDSPNPSVDLGRTAVQTNGSQAAETDGLKPVSISRPSTPSIPISPSQPVTTKLPPPRPVTPKPSPSSSNTHSTQYDNPPDATAQSLSRPLLPNDLSSSSSATPAASPALSTGQIPTSPKPARRAPPSVPSKPASATATPTGSDDGAPDEDHIPSVKSLRARFTIGNNAEASSSTASLPRSISADAPRPSAPVVALKQVSAPTIRRTSTDGKTENSVPLSPEPESKLEFVTSPQPVRGGIPGHRPAPPPPTSRTSSPAPHPPDRAHKPPPRATASPAPPAPPTPPSRNTSSPAIPPEPFSAPPLPQRRATIVVPEAIDANPAPPPIPNNRPALTPTPHTSTSASDTGPGPPPPRLPSRSRASTISRPENEPNVPSDIQPPPPRLPARTATLPSSAAAPPSHPSSPSRSRENTNELLPPPLRSALLNSASASVSSSPPSRRRTNSTEKEKDENYSEDEDDEAAEDSTPIAGLSASAKRLLEDFPDSTEANRRSPNFKPDLKIRDCHHVSAFATFGRHVCTGAHHVRIYDTQLSDQPISTVDLRDTGLEHKSKDPKVTAMCFRPGATLASEGRYLWCGTKDGHLWELDISTLTVSSTKAFAHTSPIAHIFRHRKNIITLDDAGKMLVYDVGDLEGKSPILIRTLRIGEKFSFAKMICGKLWTSSGPVARSTTSASTSKGPTIRIYDPCSEGNMPPAKVLFTTEWTGAVTSATYIPLEGDKIYLGHEGGFVSIWDMAEYSCLQVMKISTTDVLALEGVGDRLWAGNRKGQISVYDVAQRPWLVINQWNGHPDNPIQALVVDPYSIEYSGRYTCWSLARDCMRPWDGLLSVDWIDKQLVTRQADYCTYRDIKLLVCSWNIDSAKPTDLSGSEANSTWLAECLNSVDSPDIIVFGFQEVIPLTDKKITAKTLLFGGKNKDSSSSSSDKVSHAYRQWLDKLTQSVRMAMPSDTPYVKIHSENLVGLFTCIFVKSSEKDSLRALDITTVKRGIGGIYGNKGAIVSRIVMDDTSLCFINVHLAAGQGQKSARNADLAAIMEDKAIFPPAGEETPFVHGGNGTGILDHELVILNGDLNYRIDQRRENVISSIAAGELSYLLEHDQLRKEMRSNHAFRLRNFEEAPITFAPTYKYNPGTNDYDSSEKRRIPAWCDRILYRKSPHMHNINYRRYETTVSDHRPISGGYSIILKAVDSLKEMDVRKELAVEWAEKEKGMLMQMAEKFDSYS
ncbi:uncharacterized protein I303_105788 [Kwoniella dejecticola CBS 10117]|uniref:Inositol polyphosphate-related phosphatase domain-containing protein n=1 Tax=Kwoniella dejecticola CBS 10117 TaxID=1296121 RepID=A0A1A6A0E1_9TREE|nr:uncharacterized protein I303_05810 [Kwoniella dejecticola CBS 10117]OBR83530.1 hypothetical protein I303_05810 [Kwoniella dejecticola CBS 10117]